MTTGGRTLPWALAEIDRTMAELESVRANLVGARAELDNVYALMRDACKQAARLAVEMEHAHNEREQLRESVAATTLLVEELTGERGELRRRLEQLTTEADDLRARTEPG